MPSFACIVFFVILALAILWLGGNLEYDKYCCGFCLVRPGDGNNGSGGDKPPDSGNCNPSRHSWWNSCCQVNPIIKEQVLKLKAGSVGNCDNLWPGDCICIPNIGSSFVGASVESIRDTVPYKHPQGKPTSEITNKPELTLDPSVIIIGKNWHFVVTGTLVVKLFQPALISGFTIIHPPKCRIPPGYETSAPKDFYVTGMNDLDGKDSFNFGNFSFDVYGRRDQTFPVDFCSLEKYQFIEFRFISNHGNPDYTALYKVRIHGDMGPPPARNASSGASNNETQPAKEVPGTKG